MTNYCKNLWAKFSELREAQAQAEAGFGSAKGGELAPLRESIGKIEVALDAAKKTWVESVVPFYGRELFGLHAQAIEQFVKDNNLRDDFYQSFFAFFIIEDQVVSKFSGAGLSRFHLGNPNLRSLAQIQTLKSFDWPTARMTDLRALTSSKKLEQIYIPDCTELESLDFVVDLPKLNNLNIENCDKILDFTPLAGVKFQVLSLTGTKFTDPSVLENSLEQLAGLEISNTDIADLNFLLRFPKLEYLGAGNLSADLSILARLTNLRGLELPDCQLEDYPFLRSLTNLEAIRLKGSKIKSLDSLQNCTKLQQLDISNTEISDISPVSYLPISNLSINMTDITDLAPLLSMKSLETIFCHNCNFSDENEKILQTLRTRNVSIYQ